MVSFKTNLRWGQRFCYINLAFGIAETIVGVILFLVNSQFKNFGEFYNDCEGSFTLVIIAGIFFIMLGVLGIYAQRVQSNIAMSIYNIGVTLQMLFIGGSLIVIIIVWVQIQRFQDDTDCTKEDLMIDLNTTYKAGLNLLCSFKCPCDANQSNFQPEVYQTFSISKKGAKKVDECQDYVNKINTKFFFGYESMQVQNYVSLLKTSEEQFNCSGFCSTNSYYVFRDINDGTPINGKDCKAEFLNFISKSIVTTVIVISIVAVYMLIVTYFSLSMIFSQEKRKNCYYNKQDKIQTPNINQLNQTQKI
ncbi:hypothetical protein ABPG74_010057 [Tetrahymena malaccensis]